MDAGKGIDSAATVIIGQRVRPGFEIAFKIWQEELNAAASRHIGFLGAEIAAPTAVQREWIVVYRFDSVGHLQDWINSATRQQFLDRGRQYFDGPATQQVISGGARPVDPLVTVVVTHRVTPDSVADFLAWQAHLSQEEAKFEGFRGTELFRPIEGVQDEWTALYRFDTAANLATWLTSKRRRELLAEGEKFSDFELRTIENSFGSWFAFDENGHDTPAPSDTKTAVAVWVGLYPTVVLLTLALSPLHMPLWLGLLIGNLLSSFVMSFLTMPYYVNRLLRRWLWPPPDAPAAKTNRAGIAVVAALMLAWVVIFYVVTTQLWTLP
ncbi:antibiotic biosynthesis monooxygenase [Nocardia sp. CA-129566]|uniref:antibiotic biosynthesis monooxygenase n=1 Tax=Nocardia sp. CA-129566 TaxID=3239976 RepID=UPI003D974081